MCSEGAQILYNENIVGIDYEVNEWDIGTCHILGTRFEIPHIDDIQDVPVQECTLVNIAIPVIWTAHATTTTGAALGTEVYNVVNRFAHVRLCLQHLDKDHILVACRILRDLLRDKHVTLALVNDGGNIHWQDLYACRYLRCGTFMFELSKQFQVDDDGISSLEALIASTEPVTDTFSVYRRWWIEVFNQTQLIGGRRFKYEHASLVRAVSSAGRAYNVKRLTEAIEEVTKQLLNWNKEWATWRVRQIHTWEKENETKIMTAAMRYTTACDEQID
ncbi:hypothetical protein PMZ80_005864 [Knufia obscura]|uniref:Uncharacterized protein n=2 Tax=Knufia TaxID=430999 RepID=A0AAN8I8F6_9EURO|nr:hypothetical protein PMZ80_005864 [Knufia obscura]KAK5954531.1 hypothetical protein OHC33_004253 [Knufia fluminis]